MPQYRAFPLLVEAIEYQPDRLNELVLMTGEYGTYTPPVEEDEDGNPVENESDSVFIVTIGGVMEVRPGDWIIKGPTGLLSSLPTDVFELSYETA